MGYCQLYLSELHGCLTKHINSYNNYLIGVMEETEIKVVLIRTINSTSAIKRIINDFKH